MRVEGGCPSPNPQEQCHSGSREEDLLDSRTGLGPDWAEVGRPATVPSVEPSRLLPTAE
jgi:hypothetical protein